MLYRVHLAWTGFELIKLVVIGTDCIGSCKFHYPDFRLNLAIWLVDIVLINFSAIFFKVNSNYLPYTVDLILNLMIWIQKQDKFIVIIWEKNGVRGEIWRQNHDKFHIPWKTERWDTWLYGFKIMVNSLS